MKKVLLTDPIAPQGERALERAGIEVLCAPDSGFATVRRLAASAQGIIVRSKLPDDIFEAAPRVTAVVVHGTGTDLVPLAAAATRGVAVANLPGSNAQSVAEYCAMAMLMLSRNIVSVIESLRAGTWDAARALGATNHEITAMTAGIVGVGEIGKRVAHICSRGFGMRVLGHQRRLDRLPGSVEARDLISLLEESDFVVVTCPLTPETRHLLNRRALARVKRGAWIINVGRGAVIEEDALVEALREERIAGAMLDVYEHYRLEPGHPLLTLRNVIPTPHFAGMTVESRVRMGVAAAEEMLRLLAGEPARNPVHADR
ncbi:MAG TPA: hydroxyacid dehydrogenase [Burkholderiales bacterium]|nr:hydroxyacid dehydrogenase [Burkholderiales bacterium]